jgi:ferredoxin
MATAESVALMRRQAVIHVDLTRCAGHGMCTLLLPELVDLDQWGYAVMERSVRDAVDARRARRAVRACPTQALRMQPLADGSGA